MSVTTENSAGAAAIRPFTPDGIETDLGTAIGKLRQNP